MAMTKKCLRASANARRNPASALKIDRYYLGDAAWHYGEPETANPYAAGTEAYEEWSAGWNDAKAGR